MVISCDKRGGSIGCCSVGPSHQVAGPSRLVASAWIRVRVSVGAMEKFQSRARPVEGRLLSGHIVAA